jgi:ketosteroid isomerase-like protein
VTTRDTIQAYFNALAGAGGWESFFSDDMTFTSFTSPVKRLSGRVAYLQATKRFYSTIRSVEVRTLLIEGDRACALTHYDLQPPAGDQFSTDVAEIFTVRDGRIDSLAIYFDTAPFPK